MLTKFHTHIVAMMRCTVLHEIVLALRLNSYELYTTNIVDYTSKNDMIVHKSNDLTYTKCHLFYRLAYSIFVIS